jgi:myo-inositol-1(or 4)-monophosphatase
MDHKSFAIGLAKEAGNIIKKNFTLGMKKEWKDDFSPITETDRAINQLVIESVKKEFPGYGVLAEEGSMPADSEYVWVCDPVDGTTPFSHGYPTFVFSLALTKNGESILGVIYDPICNRLVIAERGKGAFLNGQKMRVSAETELTKTSFVNLDGDYKLLGLREWLIKDKDCYISTLYACVYGGFLVAAGEFSAQVYEYDKPWDAAAVKIVVEEAGGKVTDLLGQEQRYDQPINGFIAGNAAINGQLVAVASSLLAK